MMSKAKARKYAKKYYHSNEDYREQKIETRKKYAESHKKEEARKSREYYATHPEYRRYKQKYARDYRKAHKGSTKR